MYTVKKVLQRNQVRKKKICTKNRNRRHLYDYEHFSPLREFQLDTKHILDKKSLPAEVYEHIMRKKFPLYEWNKMFALLNARLHPIPPGAKHLQAIVENSHRKDDESLLSIHPKRCKDSYEFVRKTQRWQDTWNTDRPSFGIGMKGKTTLEKLRVYKTLIQPHIYTFPVLLVEAVIQYFRPAIKWFETYFKLQFMKVTGIYVRVRYRIRLQFLRISQRIRIVLIALPLFAVSASAVAQDTDVDAGRIIGRSIAVGVLLASDTFAATGCYQMYDDAKTTFCIRQLGGRYFFKGEGAWEPFIGAQIGQVLIDQRISLAESIRGDSDFDVWGIEIEGGMRMFFGRGWFGEIGSAVSYSSVKNRLRYPNPGIADSLGPLIDGVFFNWDAEVITLQGRLVLGWESRPVHGVGILLKSELIGLRMDPIKTDDPIQDVTVNAHYARVSSAFEIPLGIWAFSLPLRFDTTIRMTFVDRELADPLDSDVFADLRLALVALLPEESKLPISAVGLAVTYTIAKGFYGWSVGISFRQ
jgi:hypothetical protein